MRLREYIEAARGNATALAAALGISPVRLSHMASGYRPIAPAMAPKIESATKGAVRRWDMREDWHEIWPELIGTKGAPRAPRKHVA
ncbi:MAG: helix-turn-helix domain-containing protein [Sulfuricaulis sp.]|nr:helix-turn-helix domain-containing protein [Sulfuricaulis sp.]